jgi:2-keto-3-deoxy-L-rhamnonate aldolase RhmA
MGRTKDRLRRGETALGGWIMIGHPTVAELLAGEGFDRLGVDSSKKHIPRPRSVRCGTARHL